MSNKRLVYLPLENRWRVEYLTPEGNIQDFEELTVSGVHQRFCRNVIMANLRRTAQELEMAGR
jgi:hypothetical protein